MAVCVCVCVCVYVVGSYVEQVVGLWDDGLLLGLNGLLLYFLPNEILLRLPVVFFKQLHCLSLLFYRLSVMGNVFQ